MEYGSRLRFALLTIGAILVLILSVWSVITIARRILGNDQPKTTATVQKTDLANYAKPFTSIKYTVEGPIVADEKYVSYEIQIGQDYRTLRTYKGYNKTLITSQQYPNNHEAYLTFLTALKLQGFTTKTKSTVTDPRGQCATGSTYIYELQDQSEQVVRSWSSTCSKSNATFGGTAASVRSLIRAQIPDLDALTKELRI